ncbi:hypothetical protein GF337_18250 [candidate division KSB1 bacterium]|nr:hypothetical protein [candidate division KSB1 bacterium]
MFIGHFGVGLAAKKIDPRPSLGTLFMASQFIDLLWPIFLLLGIEKVQIDPGNTAFTPLNFLYYPFSHGFVSVLIWSLLFGLVYFAIKKKLKSAVLLGGLVLSHWILDLITHRPDLPLMPGSEAKVGLGLWDSVFLTIIVEGLIFIIGSYLFIKATKADNKKGQVGLWSLLIFLVVVYAMNTFGTPPPSTEPIAYVGLSMWLLVAWGYWIDRNRSNVNVQN